jgi:type VI protein secretion system component VasK
MFEQPLINAWGVILDRTQDRLNSLWKNRVYSEFRSALAERYPFNKGGRDATLADLENFFAPEKGILAAFLREELGPFMDWDDWAPKTWEDRGIRISVPTLAAFRRAENLQKNLFQPGFPIYFRMKPATPDSYEIISGQAPYILTIELNIDGQSQSYQMGYSSYKEFSWPSSEGVKGARLQIVMEDKNLEPPPKEYSGAWGLFKLLEEAEIEADGQVASDYRVSWMFSMRGRYQVRVKYLLAAGSVSNPFGSFKDFFQFQCPEELFEQP